MSKAFLLEHLHVISEGNECVKTIGIYSSKSSAMEAVERLKSQSGFSEQNELNPSQGSGFFISEYEVDVDHWREGFVTVD